MWCKLCEKTYDKDFSFCPTCGVELVARAATDDFPKKLTVYLYSDKENMRESGKSIGLVGEASDEFVRALYGVEFVLSVNADGTYEIKEVKE